MHRVGEKSLERATFADGLLLIAAQELVELGPLFALGEHLEAVVVVTHILLVNAEHRKQHVEQIS